MNTLLVGFRMGPAAVYRYLSGPSFERLNNFNVGQLLLFLLAVVACLFLVIQGVALVMGADPGPVDHRLGPRAVCRHRARARR
jgi:cytochrome b subunit of formate dehydrogenase